MDSGGSARPWHQWLRIAALTSGVGAIAWTILMILPFSPFSSIPPIIVGGGPGTWLVLGYLLYLVTGFGGLSALSVLLYPLESGGRRPVGWVMAFGVCLYYAGSSIACWLLGIAGYAGGYAFSIQRLSNPSIQSILAPYLDPVTLAALAACAGAALMLGGIYSAGRASSVPTSR